MYYFKPFIESYIYKKIPGGRISGDEYIAPSPLQANDFKRHFSLNIESGLWQDWKLGEGGNIFKIVSILEDIPYEAAKHFVLLNLFKNNYYYSGKEENYSKVTINTSVKQILEEACLERVTADWIDEEGIKFDALGFILKRNLFSDHSPFYLATEGSLKDRLIIPYIKNNSIYYFQARRLREDIQPKYLTPSGSCGLDKKSILYPFNENDGGLLAITEGPLDAISLQLNLMNATCIMGSHISKEQMDHLKSYKGKLVIGFNNDNPLKYAPKDPPGIMGLYYFAKLAKLKCIDKFYFCFPPNPYKDWNDMHAAGEDASEYIYQNYKEYSELTFKLSEKSFRASL